jgi:DNA (cytosine-5)-methyltransferase 1
MELKGYYMRKIKIFETFAGIGAQTKALKNISSEENIIVENVGISEWYINAIIAYSKIHHLDEFNQLIEKYKDKTKEEIIKEFEDNQNFVFSSDSKKVSNLKNIKEKTIKELYVANKVSKNYGSINEIKGIDLPNDIDILTYSFPCQSLSLQGKQGGLSKDSGTTSSLIWQVLRLLKEAKAAGKLPKVLLMENVKSLFNSKFICTWNEVKSILDSYGYNTYDTTINALDKGSIQRRERVFGVSILKEIDTGFSFNNSNHKKNNKSIRDILEGFVDEKFFLNKLVKHIGNEEFKLKPSGISSLTLQNYTTFQSENILYSINGKAPTFTASGANSRIKIIDKDGELRYLTPQEAWILMGFDVNDIKVNSNLSNATLYRLAGNSIVVEVLEDIFQDILKII